MRKLEDLKVAIAHDFLNQYGGAERVLEVLLEIFPDAPIYTLLYDEEKMRGKFSKKQIKTSYLQKFPKFIRKRHRWLLPFFLVIPEIFDFREYDLVISSSGAWAKGIVTKLNTIHISYLHSPMRFVWDYNEKYLKKLKEGRFAFFARFFLSYVRMWDRLAADRPDFLISNSEYTRERVKKYYRRESKVIYPPAYIDNAENQVNEEREDYFILISRLSQYKRADLVVEAFNKLELPLVVIGEGEQEKYLKKISKSNIKIVGWKDDESVRDYLKKARGLIFPSDDDFGITIVEAMSYGVPVIALKKGGAIEIVEGGITGEFFEAQTPEILASGVKNFIENESQYDREVIKEKAKMFSKEKFKEELTSHISDLMETQ